MNIFIHTCLYISHNIYAAYVLSNFNQEIRSFILLLILIPISLADEDVGTSKRSSMSLLYMSFIESLEQNQKLKTLDKELCDS